ncbi:MAG: SOS response-associated peptidase family protein [Alkalibacterium sp.]|nr:SOS response-associated peptidase family protein [Alkalibacterium sp.]
MLKSGASSRPRTFSNGRKWKGQKKKDKKRIAVKDLPIFSIAGICERYTDDDGESVLTYSILTTEANDQMRLIHDRMSVILNPADEKHYLNLEADPKEVQALLRPTEKELHIK